MWLALICNIILKPWKSKNKSKTNESFYFLFFNFLLFWQPTSVSQAFLLPFMLPNMFFYVMLLHGQPFWPQPNWIGNSPANHRSKSRPFNSTLTIGTCINLIEIWHARLCTDAVKCNAYNRMLTVCKLQPATFIYLHKNNSKCLLFYLLTLYMIVYSIC